MIGWMDALNLALSAAVLGLLLWGLRQKAIVRRLRRGAEAIRSGKYGYRVRRSADDVEPALRAFDEMAARLERDAQAPGATATSPHLGSLMGSLSQLVQTPLYGLRGYASLLAQSAARDGREPDFVWARQTLHEIDDLMALFGDSRDFPELLRELSSLRRRRVAPGSVCEAPVLLLFEPSETRAAEWENRLGPSGWNILWAATPEAAITLARWIPIRLVLVDALLPQGAAFTLIARLEDAGITPQTPIWLYGMDPQGDRSRFLAPTRIRVWPCEFDDDPWWTERRESATSPIVLSGSAFGERVRDAMDPSEDIELDEDDTLEMPACCLAWPDFSALGEFALLVSADRIEGDGNPGSLALDYAQSPQAWDHDSEVFERLIRRLEAISVGVKDSSRTGGRASS